MHKLRKKNLIIFSVCVLIFIISLIIGVFGIPYEDNAGSKIIFEGYSQNYQNAEINDVKSEMQELDGNVEVTVKLDYNEDYVNSLLGQPKPSENANNSEVDAYIAKHRARMKNYFSAYNEETTKNWNVNANITKSQYSPYVFLDYDSNVLSDESFNQLESLADDKAVERIYIHYKSESIPQYTMTDAMQSTGVKPYVDSGELTGNGVAIAILETNNGVVHKDNPNFAGKDLVVRWNLFNKESDHATIVASIAAGHTGVARNAKVLSGYVLTNGSTVIDWFLDNGANIVNCSYGSFGNNLGKYTSLSAYLDYMTRNNWLTFVAAAGNEGGGKNPNLYVTPPGTAYNVVTVGATSTNYYLANYSCYNLNGLYNSKPTLVAPGNYKGIPNTIASSTNKIHGGTSYSTPFVSGCVALLMEYKPILKVAPEVIISALTATAQEMNSYNEYEYSGFEKKVGAGMLNFKRAKKAVDMYYSFSRKSGAQAEQICVKPIILFPGKTVQASVAWIVKTDKDKANYGITNYDIYLLDLETKKYVAMGYSNTNNVEMLRYKADKISTYHLIVIQREVAKYDDWGAMCYTIY